VRGNKIGPLRVIWLKVEARSTHLAFSSLGRGGSNGSPLLIFAFHLEFHKIEVLKKYGNIINNFDYYLISTGKEINHG
jgi:hypothetical protein